MTYKSQLIKLLTPTLLGLILSTSLLGKDSKLPHIVLLIGDDHGFPYFGFMGDEHVVTPAMDTLSDGGVTFTQGFTAAAYCRPSLRALMTGLQPVQYSMKQSKIVEAAKNSDPDYAELSKDQKRMWEAVQGAAAMLEFDTLPKILKQKGYTSWQGGKWWENSYRNGYFDKGMTQGWDMSKFGTDDFFHELMGSEGNELGRETMQPLFDFIDEYHRAPMFIWYGPMLPHTPFDAPYKYRKYYEHQNLSKSAKMYYSNITWWDDGVGQLMDYLEELGILNNTLFIYTTDNGWEQDADVEYARPGATIMNDTLLSNGGIRGKSGLHDQSFRSPIIFYWKDHLTATFNETSLVSMTDIVPTILDIVGLESKEDLKGRSLKPLLKGKPFDERSALVGYTDNQRSTENMMGQRHEGYFVRTHRWHFIHHASTGEMELYDMTVDEQSDHNVIDANKDLIDGFLAEIEQWKQSMNMKKWVRIDG